MTSSVSKNRKSSKDLFGTKWIQNDVRFNVEKAMSVIRVIVPTVWQMIFVEYLLHGFGLTHVPFFVGAFLPVSFGYFSCLCLCVFVVCGCCVCLCLLVSVLMFKTYLIKLIKMHIKWIIEIVYLLFVLRKININLNQKICWWWLNTFAGYWQFHAFFYGIRYAFALLFPFCSIFSIFHFILFHFQFCFSRREFFDSSKMNGRTS